MKTVMFTEEDMINYAMWLAMCYAPVDTPLMEENREWYKETLKDFQKNEERNKNRKFKVKNIRKEKVKSTLVL